MKGTWIPMNKRRLRNMYHRLVFVLTNHQNYLTGHDDILLRIINELQIDPKIKKQMVSDLVIRAQYRTGIGYDKLSKTDEIERLSGKFCDNQWEDTKY